MKKGKQYKETIKRIKLEMGKIETTKYKIVIKEEDSKCRIITDMMVILKEVTKEELIDKKDNPTRSGNNWILYHDDGMTTIYHTEHAKVKVKILN